MKDDFDSQNKARWAETLRKAFPDGVPQSATWTDVDAIVGVLRPFSVKNLNHTMLPFGGGLDIDDIARSKEAGCIELLPTRGVAYVFRPRILHFEYIPDSEWNSFFLLEAADLPASGVYEQLSRPREELLELPNGEYLDRSHLDAGMMGYDENGHEIPIPNPHRLVVRYHAGKFLFVAKRSIWNRVSATYDGRHGNMSAAEIRSEIESAVRALREHITA